MSDDMNGWQPIATAKDSKHRYICGAWKWGSRWCFAEVFEENDDWVDVSSDRIHTPTHWMPLPEDQP